MNQPHEEIVPTARRRLRVCTANIAVIDRHRAAIAAPAYAYLRVCEAALHHATLCPYFVLEMYSGMVYIHPVLLAEGRLPVTSAGGAGCGARASGCQPDLRGPGTRPTGTKTRVRGASLYGRRANMTGTEARKRGPGQVLKSPQWSAERRASLIAKGGGAPRSVPGCSQHPGASQAPRLSALCFPSYPGRNAPRQ